MTVPGKIEKNAPFFKNHNSVQRESIILGQAPFKFPVALAVPRKPQKVQRLYLAWKNTQKFGFSFMPDPYSMLHPSWSLTEVTLCFLDQVYHWSHMQAQDF